MKRNIGGGWVSELMCRTWSMMGLNWCYILFCRGVCLAIALHSRSSTKAVELMNSSLLIAALKASAIESIDPEQIGLWLFLTVPHIRFANAIHLDSFSFWPLISSVSDCIRYKHLLLWCFQRSDADMRAPASSASFMVTSYKRTR